MASIPMFFFVTLHIAPLEKKGKKLSVLNIAPLEVVYIIYIYSINIYLHLKEADKVENELETNKKTRKSNNNLRRNPPRPPRAGKIRGGGYGPRGTCEHVELEKIITLTLKS